MDTNHKKPAMKRKLQDFSIISKITKVILQFSISINPPISLQSEMDRRKTKEIVLNSNKPNP